MTNVLRLCLDLNIWCAALLADKKGKQGTASQSLVMMARQGYCELGLVQLVVCWGMLDRLRLVLERDFKVPELLAEVYVDTIKRYAELGPLGAGPQLTLGGTNVLALRDIEDAHVLEAALAGRAKVLVTANFDDFIIKKNDTSVIEPDMYAIHTAPAHTVHIAHPKRMMNWLRFGQIPD